MAKNINDLPYLRLNHPKNIKEEEISNFLIRNFRSKVRLLYPQHYFVCSETKEILNFIKEKSKKYPYFLRLDVEHYYPSINHQILLQKLPLIYKKLTQKEPSRRLRKVFKKEIPDFLESVPFGLPIGSRLSWVLAALFLLDLDLKIKNPFLRQTDDYLIFCRNKKEPEEILKNIILPGLRELNLSLNQRKLKSGRFHRDKVDFIGFNFYANYFQIKEEKVEKFKKKIKELTSLSYHHKEENLMRLLNNQILGFGHYYKLASGTNIFQDLDAFIRMRLRRYLLHQKAVCQKEGNLILTNEVLGNLGLKSLLKIKEEFDSSLEGRKFLKKINREKSKKQPKSTQNLSNKNYSEWSQLEGKAIYYQQKLILNQLKEVTNSLKKIERRLTKLEHRCN